MEISEKVVRDLKKRFETESNRKEAEIVDHWRKEIEVIYRKRYEELSSLQVELKGLMDRMNNRVAILNRMVREES
jgi:hypothetical protein